MTERSPGSKLLKPDVVRLRYEIGSDWAGDSAVFFKVTVRNEVFADRRTTELSPHISDVINRVLEPRKVLDPRHRCFRHRKAFTNFLQQLRNYFGRK